MAGHGVLEVVGFCGVGSSFDLVVVASVVAVAALVVTGAIVDW